MKRRFLLIMLLAAMFAPLAMQAQVLMEAPRALNHQVVKQTPQTREAGWLQYDNGTLAGLYGLGANSSWTYGAMYPSSMLSNNNTLSKVKFYQSDYMTGDVIFNIYSGGTDAPGTLLYTEAVATTGVRNWVEVELAEPVTIDPTQNLWIIITVDASGNYVFPVCSTSESNDKWFYYAGTWYHIGDLVSGMANYGWMIRGYVEYIEAEACPKPTQFAATNITTNSATLSWHSEARSYEVVYSNREGFNPDTATPIEVTETSYNLTDLTDGTSYYAYVRANCGDSYSQWSNMLTFTTISACATPYNVEVSDVTPISANISWDGWQDSYTMRYMVPSFYDGFENDLEGWTVYTQGTAPQTEGWYAYNASNLENGSNHNGNAVASSWSWSSDPYNADNYLVTPQVTLGSTLLFWEYTNAGYPDSYEVLLSTTGNEIADFTVTLRALQPASINGWHLVTVDLGNYANQQGYIAIHHVDYDMNYLFIDDFCIGDWTPVSNVTSPYAFTNLTPETTYVAQIQGICPGGTTDWSDGVVISTPSSCQGPTNLASTDVTANTAALSWEGYQDSYNIQYRTASYREVYFFDDFENGEGDWRVDGGIYYFTGDESNHFVLLGYTSEETQYLITPELPEYADGSTVEFDYRINGTETTFIVGYSSTTDDESAFTWGRELPATTNDITVFSEEIPTGTKYIAIQTTGVAFIIDNFGIYDPNTVPAGEWQPVEGETSPYTLSGLTADTQYEWQVQGINPSCDNGVTEWSESAFFTTQPLCLVPTNLDVDNITTNSAVVTWVSEATSFEMEVNGGDPFEVTNPYTLTDLNPGTLYSVRVRTNCGESGYSDWTTAISFYTECEAYNLPYTYGFETENDMACWDVLAANSANMLGRINMTTNGFEAYEGDYGFIFSSYEQAQYYDQLLISPELNSGDAQVAVEFSYLASGNYDEEEGNAEVFDVMYSTTTADLDAFEVAATIQATNTEEWMTYRTILPAGTKYVCLWYYSNYQYYLFVDGFSFTESAGAQTIDLVEGWNWVSLTIDLNEVDGIALLEEALGDHALTIATFGDQAEYVGDGLWLGLEGYELTNSEMVMIEAVEDCSVTLEGAAVDPSTVEITVNPGWTWIGYPLSVEMAIADALGEFEPEFGDGIANIVGLAEYLGDWEGDFDALVPGQGYMYYTELDESRTFVFQSGSKARLVKPFFVKVKPSAEVKGRVLRDSK